MIMSAANISKPLVAHYNSSHEVNASLSHPAIFSIRLDEYYLHLSQQPSYHMKISTP